MMVEVYLKQQLTLPYSLLDQLQLFFLLLLLIHLLHQMVMKKKSKKQKVLL
jgi:hypothetical protein